MSSVCKFGSDLPEEDSSSDYDAVITVLISLEYSLEAKIAASSIRSRVLSSRLSTFQSTYSGICCILLSACVTKAKSSILWATLNALQMVMKSRKANSKLSLRKRSLMAGQKDSVRGDSFCDMSLHSIAKSAPLNLCIRSCSTSSSRSAPHIAPASS